MEEMQSEMRKENLELKKQVELMSQKCLVLLEIELVTNSARAIGE